MLGIFLNRDILFLINVVMHAESCLDICLSEVYGDLVVGLFCNNHVFILLKFTTHARH